MIAGVCVRKQRCGKPSTPSSVGIGCPCVDFDMYEVLKLKLQYSGFDLTDIMMWSLKTFHCDREHTNQNKEASRLCSSHHGEAMTTHCDSSGNIE